jgi:hypothetical protein
MNKMNLAIYLNPSKWRVAIHGGKCGEVSADSLFGSMQFAAERAMPGDAGNFHAGK